MRRDEEREQPHTRDSHVVQSVTSAPQSGADDQGHRMRRYLLTMGIRVACGALAIVTTGWLRWTMVGLALVLPYVAVVMANAVGPREGGSVAPVEQQVRALPTTPLRSPDEERTIHGRVVDD